MVVRNPARERSTPLSFNELSLRQRQIQIESQEFAVHVVTSKQVKSVSWLCRASKHARDTTRCLDRREALSVTFIVKSIAIRTITLIGIAEATVSLKGLTLGELHSPDSTKPPVFGQIRSRRLLKDR